MAVSAWGALTAANTVRPGCYKQAPPLEASSDLYIQTYQAQTRAQGIHLLFTIADNVR
jgi:hypothetical protein